MTKNLDELLNTIKGNVDNSPIQIKNGNRTYIKRVDNDGSTILESKIKITHLTPEIFTYDENAWDVDLEPFVEEYAVDVVTELDPDENSFITDSKTGNRKIEIYANRKPELDKHIRIMQEGYDSTVNGLIVDLFEDQDFINTCAKGIVYTPILCDKFLKMRSVSPTRSEKFMDRHFDEMKMEIVDLFYKTFEHVQGGASYRPIGLYAIFDNNIYYYTGEEYSNLSYQYFLHGDPKEAFEFQGNGFDQSEQHLLTSTKRRYSDYKKFLMTQKVILSDVDLLTSKPHVSLDSAAELGMSKEDFLVKLLLGEEEVFQFLKNRLNPNESSMGHKMGK